MRVLWGDIFDCPLVSLKRLTYFSQRKPSPMSLQFWLRSLRAQFALPKTARRVKADVPRAMQLAEPLESRCLLAVTPVLVNDTELLIQLEASDSVVIQADSAGKLEVLSSGLVVNGNPDIFTADITSITVTGGDGPNRIDLTGVTAANFDAALTVTVNGGDGGDTIFGSEFADSLVGGNGADSITGALEDDTLDGSHGNDTMSGGVGEDSILGGDGADSIHGDAGDDTVVAGNGADEVFGDSGLDSINGGDGSDTLNGDADNDTLSGDNGNDSLLGGADNDSVFGGSGNDTASGGDGLDTLSGGADNDSMNGDTGTDSIDGDAGNDVLNGGTENDTINAGSGNDTVNGDSGNDLLFGGAGNDSIVGGLDDDTVFGQSGNDTIVGDGGADSLDGGAGNDLISSQSNIVGLFINDVSISEGDVGTVNAMFTVGLTPVSTQTVTVTFTVTGDTAISGTDFLIPTTTTVVFLPNVATQTILIPIVGDTLTEPSETFVITLSNAVNATIIDNQGQGTILDADVPAGATLTPGPNVNVSNLPGFQSEVSIAVNPANPQNLVAGSNNPSTGEMDAYFSTDGGATWQVRLLPLTVDGTAFARATDPAVGFDRQGIAYFAYELLDNGFPSRASNVMARSTDGGNTWTAVLVTPAGAGDDKEFIGIGPDRANPNVDRIYMGWQRSGTQLVSSSLDGISWSAPVQVNVGGADEGINSQIAVGPQGEVYFSWQEFGSAAGVGPVAFSRSLDGGLTWSAPIRPVITNVSPFNDPISGGQYLIPPQPMTRGAGAHLSIDVDRSGGAHNGRIYMSIMDQGDRDGDALTGHADTDIFVLSSSDGGVTWSPLTRVNDDATNTSQFFAWIQVDQTNGLVALSWYDARNDVANNQQAETFMTTSIDGGATFVPNVRVATATSDQSDANPDADLNGYGDYSGLAVYNNIAHPVWSDSRNRTNPDVFTAAVTIAVTSSGGPGGVNVGTSLPSTVDLGDILIGGDGNDTIVGAAGNDILNGMAGNDSLVGGAGTDNLLGGSGVDTLDGGDGDDTLDGQAGNDRIAGGAGSDTYIWNGTGDGVDTLSSLSGYDRVRVQGSAVANNFVVSQANGQLRITDGTAVLNVSPIIQVVDILAGDGDDTITINALDRVQSATLLTIDGGDGNDTINSNGANIGLMRVSLIGGLGDDSLTGSAGIDSLNGGDGDDVLDGQGGNDLIFGGIGDDTILGGAGNDRILAGDGADSIDAGTGDDTVTGEVGADTINGAAGNDSIDAGDGTDNVDGGDGNDSILGGNEADSLNGNLGNDTVRGGGSDDTITGENGNDKLYGDDGNDSIVGHDGNDTLSGGDGDDTVDGGNGNDLLGGGIGEDVLTGAAGTDTLPGGDGTDTMAGGAGRDVLLGDEGDDSINGQGGTDTINPGEGSDNVLDPVSEIDTNFTLSAALLAALA